MFKLIWNALNGKKFISGLVLTGIGFGAKHLPGLESTGDYIMLTGLSMVGIGGGHKVKKYLDKKKEK